MCSYPLLIMIFSFFVLFLFSCGGFAFFSSAEPFSQYTIKLAANTLVGKGPFAARNYSAEEGGI